AVAVVVGQHKANRTVAGDGRADVELDPRVARNVARAVQRGARRTRRVVPVQAALGPRCGRVQVVVRRAVDRATVWPAVVGVEPQHGAGDLTARSGDVELEVAVVVHRSRLAQPDVRLATVVGGRTVRLDMRIRD